MTTPISQVPFDSSDDGLPPRGDELDVMLREWHEANRAQAAAGRDRLLAALRAEDAAATAVPAAVEAKPAPGLRIGGSAGTGWKIWRIAPLAAAAVLTLAVLAPFMLPVTKETAAHAELANIVMCPEGGRLEAYDAGGALLGPCVLKHTDVAAEITGHIARVTLKQTFENPHTDKIEAVYTFPMSHRGAVDRMSMTIGDRVIVGEVKEREEAREIYETAREAGLVAALTEQERPNIFTQSVANIEPGARIEVTLSYVEFVEEKDGEFTFSFPTVVGPRYIPGEPISGGAAAGLTMRKGLVLQGPASFEFTGRGPGYARSERGPDQQLLAAAIHGAVPIEQPARIENENRWVKFTATYADGSKEEGIYFDTPVHGTSVGYIANRWFALAGGKVVPAAREVEAEGTGEPGAAFAPNTDQVPDASRITPMPVRPGMRSGHDLSISVRVSTGGPGLLGFSSPLHEIVTSDRAKRGDGLATDSAVTLKKLSAIPNRDFVLSWKQTAEGVSDQVFTHTGKHGGFFGLMLRPPARVDDAMAVPRELIFVVDTSGSMNGFPIEKSKDVMERALASMREGDTFNVITFAGATKVLWESPRPATAENVAEARALLAQQNGRGGTEMMTAVNAALVQSPPKEDRVVRPLRIAVFLTDGYVGNDVAIIDAVKRNRGTTRVFGFGIGNSVNRYLLDSIALAGGGASEYVLLESDAAAAVERLTKRTRTPVLTDIRVEFSANLSVRQVAPALDNIPDLFDESPVMILGRFDAPGAGTVTLRGMTAAGPWQKTITLSLPEHEPAHDTIATMWARAQIEQVKARDLQGVQNGTLASELRGEIVRLGEQFGIMSEYTSFVAVDKLRVTVAGKPRLVNVPVELPAGTNFEGFFGAPGPANVDDELPGRSLTRLVEEVPAIVRVQAVTAPGDETWMAHAGAKAGGEAGESLNAGGVEADAESAPPPPPPPSPSPDQSRSAAAQPGVAAPMQPSAAPAEARPTGPARGVAAHTESKSTPEPAGPAGGGKAMRDVPADGRAAKSPAPRTDAAPRIGKDLSDANALVETGQVREKLRQGQPPNSTGRGGESQASLGRPQTDVLARSLALYGQTGGDPKTRGLERAEAEKLQQNSALSLSLETGNARDVQFSLGIPVSVVVAEPQRQNQVNMVVPAQQVAMRIGELAKINQTEQARALVEDLNRAAPEYGIARSMWAAFNETKAPLEVQTKQVAQLAEQAKEELSAAARRIELHRKLEPRLWSLALGEGVMPRAAADISDTTSAASCSNMVDPQARQMAAQAGVELRDLDQDRAGAMIKADKRDAELLEQGVVVTVLLTSTEPAVLEQLRAAGMIVEDVQAKANVVVGIVPVGRLAEFALLECVRRVEPTPAE